MRRFLLASAALILLASPAWLAAQDARPLAGSLLIGGKTYKLTHAVAFAAKHSDEPATVVIASDRVIDAAAIKASLQENDGSDEDISLHQPHVMIVFDKEGQAHSCSAYAGGTSTTTSGDTLSGELKLDAGRAVGKAKLALDGEGAFQRSLELTFDLGLLGSAAEAAQKAAPLTKLGVTGAFKGNGKPAKLAFASAHPREAFGDKPSLVIVLTEKDHSRDKKPDFKAGFGDYGSALIISCHQDGSIFGCEISHAAHKKRGFSSVGSIETTEFQIAGGQVQGRLKTDGEQEFFGDTWEVDLQFAAPYTAQSGKTEAATGSDKPATPRKPTTTAGDDKPAKPAEPAPPAKPAAAKLNVKDLAILKGVEGVEYKKLVEHVGYKSDTNYKKLAGEIAKQLAAQGWKADGSDLIGVSAILKRTRGEASLTIFVKPAGSGSTVTIFTEGLEWGD